MYRKGKVSISRIVTVEAAPAVVPRRSNPLGTTTEFRSSTFEEYGAPDGPRRAMPIPTVFDTDEEGSRLLRGPLRSMTPPLSGNTHHSFLHVIHNYEGGNPRTYPKSTPCFLHGIGARLKQKKTKNNRTKQRTRKTTKKKIKTKWKE
eukprot:scaffold2466_cov333-Pavlova_lutheri.AAC.1